MRFIRKTVLLVLGVMGSACASGGTGTGSPENPQPARRDQNVITAEELNADPATNVYDAIRHLRPSMLTARGAGVNMSLTTSANSSETGQISIYLDGAKLGGGTSTLGAIPISGIKEIRYLNGSDATQRYGTGNASGAIVISSR
jgi:hypothetical protein